MLITLLVLGVLANVAHIGTVAWLNHRAASRRRMGEAAEPSPVVADAADSGPPEVMTPGESVEPIAASEAVPPATGRSPTRQGSRTTTDQPPAPATRSAADAPGARRRFVMPEDEGSHARTDRAIALILGEPVAPDPETRSHRRRHRARRAAGTPVPKTDLVVSFAGSDPDPRIVHALSAALRGAVRASDQVVELPDGQLRITLEADSGGGEAFARRAHGVVRPWLAALDPLLELRVERPSPRAEGAATTS